MGLIEDCEEYFGTRCLYEVLSVEKTATIKELKTAYKKTSLRVHPDRVEENCKAEATQKFQTLAQVYFILSDKEKRAIYNETGDVGENALPEEKDWTAYWRLIFPRISLKDIDDFIENYKGSQKELEDLAECYTKCEGDMEEISEHMLCYENEDEDRYREMISNLIKEGKVKQYKKFGKDTKAQRNARKLKYAKEAGEAEEERRKLGLNDDCGESSLKNAIMQRMPDRKRSLDNMISSLEAKYCQPKGKKARRGKK